MRNLLQLLMRFGGLIMFLILEGVCFYLIVNYNKEQHQIFFSSANRVTGNIYEKFSAARRYFSLGAENEILLRDNEVLKGEKEVLLKKISDLQEQFQDSIPPSVPATDSILKTFRFIGARIISNSVSGANNILTIDKGKKDGVKDHVGVVNSQGIIGVVINSSENYALVMSVLHQQTRISASIKDKKYFGTLVWRGGDPRFMYLEAVPKYALNDIKEGNIVQTSGFSFKFPPGIVIGKVISVAEAEGGDSLEIEVELINDLSGLGHAYLSIFQGKEELKILERTGDYE